MTRGWALPPGPYPCPGGFGSARRGPGLAARRLRRVPGLRPSGQAGCTPARAHTLLRHLPCWGPTGRSARCWLPLQGMAKLLQTEP
ncbi:hypothetical protein Y1Q_0012072 [Alligator mississippiensis]|uniref:Uncharacterized protein n=1 Tax=Alligator mississippiensis TaxID=8496 RepID=A0A151P5G6_ALLMI|nr:hypothetical protein Y1Q_0012072 [Alligator mississippiensis]